VGHGGGRLDFLLCCGHLLSLPIRDCPTRPPRAAVRASPARAFGGVGSAHTGLSSWGKTPTLADDSPPGVDQGRARQDRQEGEGGQQSRPGVGPFDEGDELRPADSVIIGEALTGEVRRGRLPERPFGGYGRSS